MVVVWWLYGAFANEFMRYLSKRLGGEMKRGLEYIGGFYDQ